MTPSPGLSLGVYRHYRGGEYRVIALAHNSENREECLVVYRSISKGFTWVRPYATPGAASWTDQVLWPDGVVRARFEWDRADESVPTTGGKEGGNDGY